MIDFNDEIVSIECVGEEETLDFEVEKDHLFFGNDILIHNSSVNKDSKEVDNSMIADSLGSAMTADFMCMLAQTEKQKEVGQITFKITKNRYTGMTREFTMDVDYKKMRFGQPKIPEEKMLETQDIKELTSTPIVDWNTENSENSESSTKVEITEKSELGKVETQEISDETQAMFDKLLKDLDV